MPDHQRTLTLVGLHGIPEVMPGADLAKLLHEAVERTGNRLSNGDVLVIAQKIVSKSEGRQVHLTAVEPTPRARELAEEVGKDPRLVELILRESHAVLRKRPGVLIVEHALGLVMASAGIDQSNVPGADDREIALLLPINPDASAQRIREELRQLSNVCIGVVINDSFGRAWRNGVTGVAIGVAGMPALVDRRGEPDRHGRPLRVTQIAAADELAAAASLLMGQGDESCPAVLVRGFPYAGTGSAADLLRPRGEDLFR